MIPKANIHVHPFDYSSLKFSDLQPCYRQKLEQEQYYNEHNSSVYQMFEEEIPDDVKCTIIDQLAPSWRKSSFSVIRIDPGNTVPEHIDTFFKVRSQFNEIVHPYRYLILLEDWKSGHYLEIAGAPIVSWKAGDTYILTEDLWHIGGNMGNEPFYSAQYTGA